MSKRGPNADNEPSIHAVWDGPTRWFHWINVVCVVALAVLGTAILYSEELGVTDDGKILLKTTHVWFGYVFAVNLGWRVAWAFFGNRQARWSAIFPFQVGYGIALRTYVRGLIRGDGRPYLGHNPVARLMVSLLILLLVVQAVTGLVLAGTDIYYPPFGYWFASWVAAPGVDPWTLVPYDKTGIDGASWDAMRAFRSPFVTVHYWNFYALLVLIVIHIVGVIVTELREGGGACFRYVHGTKGVRSKTGRRWRGKLRIGLDSPDRRDFARKLEWQLYEPSPPSLGASPR